MIPLQVLQHNSNWVIERLAVRNLASAEKIVQEILALDSERRRLIAELEQNRAEMNKVAKSVGAEIAKGNHEAAEAAKQHTQTLKASIASQETELATVLAQMESLQVQLPNTPHESVPAGRSADDNLIVHTHERQIHLPENPLPHWELARKHDIIDWELGVKITGAGFPVYTGKGARLQRALINFFLDEAEKAGYTEVQPPILVNEASGFGTGQLPDKEGQMYFVTEDKLYLIPTAEVPITNIFRDEIIDEDLLPVKRCGYTPCFRREAGSYGKDVRGLNRLHQFDKVEIVQITQPEKSYDALEEMQVYVRSLLEKLELMHRVALLCGGDMGFASAKTYDMEAWSGAQGRWLEVSSVSNFEAFQTTRLKLRYRNRQTKKTTVAHSLNGSALALPRIVAALLENNQQADGSILIPEVLHPYTGFAKIG